MAFGAGNNAWFVVPTVMFTAIPLAGGVWTFLVAAEQSWWARTVELAPLLLGFAVPVFLLLAAYLELGRRSSRGTPAGPLSQAVASSSLTKSRVEIPTAVASRSTLR